MASYLMIESRDPFESGDVGYYYDLARGLAREGHQVTLFLVQNGVLPARRGPHAHRLADLARGGVRIVADSFSLRERGVAFESLVMGVQPGSLDVVVDMLADAATRALWH